MNNMDRSIEQDPRRDYGTDDARAGENSRASGEDSRKPAPDHVSRLRAIIDQAAKDGPTLSAFMDRLEKEGVRAIPSLQRSGRLNGMSYEIEGQCIKGSALGRSYTAAGLQQRKGVRYIPVQDNIRLQEAFRQARERALPTREMPRRERVTRAAIDRGHYETLTTSQRETLWQIGRFRTILAADFLRIQYRGERDAWQRDLRTLTSLKLLEQRSVVIATHSKTHGRQLKTLSVLVLTKHGKNLVRSGRKDPGLPRQALYAGLVKPREIAHDAAIYRLYHAEAARIERDGGRIRRVVLDFELKKRAYSPLARAQKLGHEEYLRKQSQVAQENGLHIVQGKIRFPDLRIEYETAGGEAERVDLELATEHYRGEHMSAKDRAGFKIYADAASFPPSGPSGRSRIFDEDHMIEIFSF